MELTPAKTLREILRLRPRAIEALDIAIGPGFWHYLDRTFSEMCREKDLDPALLLHRISALSRVSDGSDWSITPVYDLVDHLAEDHLRFRERDLPGIEQQLAECNPSDFPPGFPLADFQLQFHSFKIDFLLHMNEEEEFLFPKALRTEAYVLHPDSHPETFRGNIGAYYDMLRTPDLEIKQMLAALRKKIAEEAAPSTPALDRIRNRVEDLESRAARHADLEVEVLLPKALEMERMLMRRSENAELAGEAN